MDGLGIEFGCIVAFILIIASIPFAYRRTGLGGALTAVASLGILSTIYVAVFWPSAADARASESAGFYNQLLATVLDATPGKWPTVFILGALSLAMVVWSVRYDVPTDR